MHLTLGLILVLQYGQWVRDLHAIIDNKTRENDALLMMSGSKGIDLDAASWTLR